MADPWTLAVTGASGGPYAVRLLRALVGVSVPVQLIVSDHGWSYDEGGRFGHEDAPNGVLILSGSGTRDGAVLSQKPSVFDVTPTVLALFGLPRSKEMVGKALLEALQPAAEGDLAGTTIDSYGTHQLLLLDGGAFSVQDVGSKESVDKLRALGYVK